MYKKFISLFLVLILTNIVFASNISNLSYQLVLTNSMGNEELMSVELVNGNLEVTQEYLNSTVNGIISWHSTGSAAYIKPFILRHGIPLSLYRYTDDCTIEPRTYGYPADGAGASGAPGLLYQTPTSLILPLS